MLAKTPPSCTCTHPCLANCVRNIYRIQISILSKYSGCPNIFSSKYLLFPNIYCIQTSILPKYSLYPTMFSIQLFIVLKYQFYPNIYSIQICILSKYLFKYVYYKKSLFHQSIYYNAWQESTPFANCSGLSSLHHSAFNHVEFLNVFLVLNVLLIGVQIRENWTNCSALLRLHNFAQRKQGKWNISQRKRTTIWKWWTLFIVGSLWFPGLLFSIATKCHNFHKG